MGANLFKLQTISDANWRASGGTVVEFKPLRTFCQAVQKEILPLVKSILSVALAHPNDSPMSPPLQLNESLNECNAVLCRLVRELSRSHRVLPPRM